MDLHLARMRQSLLLDLPVAEEAGHHSEDMLDVEVLLGRALDILPLVALEQVLGDLLLAHSPVGGPEVHLVAH
jgi:hypothetical protein